MPPVTEKHLSSQCEMRLGVCVVKLSGVIDESVERSQISGDGAPVVVFDLHGVRRITSSGVREWVNAMRQSVADYVGFINCRPSIVTQFNLVAGFAGRGELVTFYAPYVCTKCAAEFDHLIDLRRDYLKVKALRVPAPACPQCQAPGELDDIVEEYFSYASSTAEPRPPANFGAALGEAPMRAFRARKLVEGKVTGLILQGVIDKTVRMKRLGEGLENEVVLVLNLVDGTTGADLLQMLQSLVTEEARFFLARVPSALLKEIALTPAILEAARLISLLIKASCTKCYASTPIELDREAVLDVVNGSPLQAACPTCQGPLRLMIDEPTRERLARMMPTVAPPEVVEFLSRHSFLSLDAAGVESTTGSDETPTQSFGRYRLVKQVGIGGMAEVFMAKQTSVGGFEKTVVVKRILPHLSADTRFVEMFFQEARLSARISHPNVVQIFDLGQVGNRYYIAMEYVRGWDLNSVLRMCRRLKVFPPLDIAARLVADICSGLNAAHMCTDEQGKVTEIIHRDVSPHNILISSAGIVKVTDFGIAKASNSESTTPTDTLKGKVSYMAPEQIQVGGATDRRSDIFAVGIILYELMTLEHLFRRDNEYQTFAAILNYEVPSVRLIRPEASEALDTILKTALARALNDRYQTAAALRQDLEALILSMGSSSGPSDIAAWVAQLSVLAGESGVPPSDLVFTPSAAARATTGTLVVTPTISPKM